MQVDVIDGVMAVTVRPEFLLDQFKSGRFGLGDMAYLCVMMYQLGLGRIRKKRAVEIDTYFVGDHIDIVQSANMCLDILTTAGMSLKGLSRFRQHTRSNCGMEFIGKYAIRSKFSNRRHVCLDVIEGFDSTKPLYNRAVVRGTAFCQKYLGDNPFYNMPFCNHTVLRIGLLALAAEADPDFTITARFDISI